MSVLSTISKPADRAVIVTIVGDSGRGKTSLASTFPKPIVIRAEDGLQAIPVGQRPDAFPQLTKVDDLWDQLGALIREEHGYKTVVIDSVTALERLFIEDIMSREKPGKGMQQACGGYGNAFDVLAGMHQRVRKAAGILSERLGINVVFVGHADTIKLELPNMDPYMSYTLRLNKRSMPSYIDDVDVVGFLRLETFLKGGEDERKMAISDGSRELICYATAENVSKNRYGITDPIPVKLGENPLEKYIPILRKEI
jgi:hypothetical protein